MTSEQHTNHSFGDWLKRRRRELDLTQETLAERVGYATPTLQKIERGVRRASRDLAERLADALDIPADERSDFLRLARSAEPASNTYSETPESVEATQPAHQLLLTKIVPPPLRKSVVARPRLTSQLDPNRAVTLVAAPAGWGKTTLVAGWIAGLSAEESRVAWVALEAADDEPVRLLRYIIAAIQRVEPAVGSAVLALLDATSPPLDAALTLLINDLSALPHRVALVLDDYHVLRAPTVHRLIAHLVEYAPAQFHLIIATREDPPLPLARLRARDQLREIRAAELRFNAVESTAFFADAITMRLPADAIATLEQRTEGWAAGLQLAALALRDRSDPEAFVRNFGGSHRLVLDYLVEEVLGNLPEHHSTFLLQTAISDRLCGPLCDAILGIGGQESGFKTDSYSQLILGELERANMFLVALDDVQIWYRYHHLFGEVLRARLMRGASPANVRQLHRRAAIWYAENELWQTAFGHAQSAQDWELAAQALEHFGKEMFADGLYRKLQPLIDALPEMVRYAHPRLLLLRGMCATADFDLMAAETYLSAAAEAFAAHGDTTSYGEAQLYLSDILRSRGEFVGAATLLQQVLAGSLTPRVRMTALGSRMFDTLVIGDWQSSVAAMRQTLDIAVGLNDPISRLELLLNAHSVLLVLPGNLAWCERLLRLARSWPVVDISPARASLDWITGFSALLRGQLPDASESIDRAMSMNAKLGGISKLEMDAGFFHGVVAAIAGDLGIAEERFAVLFAAFNQPTRSLFLESWSAIYRYYFGWLRWQQGRIAEAHAVLSDMNAAAGAHEWPIAPCARLMLRGLLATTDGDSKAAETAFHAAIAEQERLLDSMMLGDARVLLAYSYLQSGSPHAATETMKAALETQVARGTPGILLFAGKTIAVPLLRLVQSQSSHATTVSQLLAALDHDAPVPNESNPDALTSREQDVLRLLADGASNSDIAATLVVSLHTVKTHVARILAKLGATNRTEAVARARSLGLL